MTFQPIINYSNEVITYPMYTEYTDIVIQSRTFNNIVLVSASRADFNNIKSGQYLFLDTGTQTSQIIKIIGINRSEYKIVLESAITVQPTDLIVRVIDFSKKKNVCVYNNGVSTVYVNGQSIIAGVKVYYTNEVIIEPLAIYGGGTFQVSEGDISIEYVPTATIPANTLLSATGFGADTETFVIPALIGVPQSKLRSITVGNTNYYFGQEINTYDDVTGTFVCYTGVIVTSTTPIFIDYIS